MPNASRTQARAGRASCLLLTCVGLAGAACSDDPTPAEAACARLDDTWSLDVLPAAPSTCPAAPAPRDVSTSTRVAVAVYHFNIQYVAGGLRGFPDGNRSPTFDLDEVQVEDRIVREGFEPALDLYLRSPSLHADFELQAYMVEVIAARHPDVLAKMRTLAERGQIEFLSFHYSDQLYVAYPAEDLERSLALTRDVFARACVPLGSSIFTQEGQFARGQIPIAARHGYRASVLPKNLLRYQFGDAFTQDGTLFADPATPEHTVIIGAQGHPWTTGPGAPFEIAWTFMDDGEIAFTQDRLNPYFGLDYKLDPERLAAHEAELLEMERRGYVHVTLREAIDAARKRGIPIRPLPPVIDGTWQPNDTSNVFRWMGGAGLFRTFEQDGDLLGAIWRARATIVGLASDDAQLSRGIRAAWRELLLAQVSDSTGWNPFRTEIAYARTHAERAAAIAADVRVCAGEAPYAPPPWPCTPGADAPLSTLGVEVMSPGRMPTIRARACTNAAAGEQWWELIVSAARLADEEPVLDASNADAAERDLDLQFARSATLSWSWTPALSDASVEYTAADYSFSTIAVPTLPGPIRLGPRRWLIADPSSHRLALHVSRDGPDVGRDRWIDNTLSRALASERRWLVLEGASEASATALARAVEGAEPK